ncbi:uncharacterized protein LOC124272446 [Haliotis rubra]|uniref:uncharacterized protein LOC124272446 n=1 Tax=Haliotis rubra TaxID=36100 RepID=UPI001EE5C3FF|nr:uncharacterized protein LOC124272446 [Haliotis rubra]
MGFQISGPLLCLVVMALLLPGGLAHQEPRQFLLLKQLMGDNTRRIAVIQDKQRLEIETLKRGLNHRIEERVKYLFRKWAGMPEIPIYCPYPVLSDKLLEVGCKGPFTEGQTCKLKCPMSVPLRGPAYITCTRSANDYTGYWAAVDGEEPKCDVPTCPPLPAPRNGALVCDKWSGGSSCQLQCREGYDISISKNFMQTAFLCSRDGVWNHQNVPHCTYREFGDRFRLPENYYFTGQCNPGNIEVKESFLKEVTKSALCPDSKYCKVENVEVNCGEEDDDEDEWDF